MGGLNEVQLRLQGPAQVLHLLMVSIGRRLVKLDDDVDRRAAIAAFERFKVFRQLVLAVGMGHSSSQQDDQSQERDPRAPSRCF